MTFDSLKHLYFLGIGGIGMSALARLFNAHGIKVSGYDRTETELTKKLVAEGIDVHYTDSPELLPAELDLVVLTPAIPADHKEWAALKARGVNIMKRSQVLGLISQNKTCLAVAGTHGKTTTSTILAHLLRSSGIDCNAILGGIAVNYGGNCLEGSSDLFVTEADEYDRSFLQLHPHAAIITATDADHLDIYGDVETMREAYSQFASQVHGKGLLVYKAGIELKNAHPNAQTYGVEKGDHQAQNIQVKDGFFYFDYHSANHHFTDLQIAMAGRHNIENATAAIAVAMAYGATEAGIREGLKSFKGIKRRFEVVYRSDKHTLIDDYAHHPEEVHAAVTAARELFPNKRIAAIFQPHLYTRTRDFYQGFAKELNHLDQVFLVEVYPARELPIEGITSDIIFDLLTNQKTLTTRKTYIEQLDPASFDVFLTIGAADIEKDLPKIIERLKRDA